MTPSKLRRQISIFDRTSELLVRSVDLSDATFDFIRSQLAVPSSDPMFDSYLLEGNLLQTLQDMLGLPTSDVCDYYLETEVCDSHSSPAPHRCQP